MDILPDYSRESVPSWRRPSPPVEGTAVVLVGVDISFGAMVNIVMKWTLAALLVTFVLGMVLGLLWMILS